ncbi:MAG: RNA polymerase sigma factor [Acidimicrobiales bacterium]
MSSDWGNGVADLDPPQSDANPARHNDAELAAFIGHIAPATGAADREDIVQDARARALAHRDSVPTGRDKDTWMRAVIRNLVRDRWRRSERDRIHGPQIAGSAIQSSPGADEFVIATLESEMVRAAFRRLSPLQRRVLQLRIVEGRPAAETGALVNRRVDDVRQIQFRAIAAMRRDLATTGWLDDEGTTP